MEDNAYNRKISDEVKRINQKMIASDVAKGYMIDDATITKNVVRGLGRRRGGDWDTDTALMTEQNINKMGSGWLDDALGVVGKVAPLAMMALGKPKKTRGRPRKGGMSTGGMSTGGIVIGGIDTGGKLKKPVGRPRKGGMSTGGINTGGKLKKTRGRPRKGGMSTGGIATGGNWLSDFGDGFVKGFTGVADIASKVLPLAGLGKKPVGRPRKGGMTNKVLFARPVGGSVAELEGSGWFDDVLSGVSTAADVATKVAPLFMGVGKKGKKGGIDTGGKKGGIETGGKRGQSKWITHVKKFAKSHNMNYRDALRDQRCKDSYIKKK